MTSPDEDTVPSSELNNLTISEDLIPSNPPVQSQISYYDFNGLLKTPLSLQTDESQCGGKAWPAGMALVQYLLENKMRELQGRTMFVVRSDDLLSRLTQNNLRGPS